MFRRDETSVEERHILVARSLRLGLLALAAIFALAGPSTVRAQAGPLRVVATVGMVGDLAARIAGPCAQVEVLMGPGVDPHLYRATPSDVRALGQAQLVLYVGLNLEGQLGQVLSNFARRTPTVAVGDVAIPPASLLTTDGGAGIDPHLWMDVATWAGIVPVLVQAIEDAGPTCAPVARANAIEVQAELAALHAWILDAVATVPPEHRILVTAHDAFAYYGRAYGMEVVSIQGVSTEAEPSIADIRATARRIADAGVPAAFIESTISPRTVDAVLDATAALGHRASIGGTLYSDAMGDPGTADGTYVGMLLANTRAVVTALGGTVPPLPEPLHAWARSHGVNVDAP